MSCRLSHDWTTIEPNKYDGYNVYAHGYYGSSSVLAGRYGRAFLDSFDSLEEAQKAYPDAELSGNTKWMVDPDPGPNPPSWFDPSIAGERWDDEW